MVSGVTLYSMADGAEDDITIIDGEFVSQSDQGTAPVFDFRLPAPSTSAPPPSSRINPASHHALSFAYTDLKKRYNELEGKNQTLLKNLHKAMTSIRRESRDFEKMNGEVGTGEFTRPRPQFGGVLVTNDNQTDCCPEEPETNLLSDVEDRHRIQSEMSREQRVKADLLRQVEELGKQHEEAQAAGEAELKRMSRTLKEMSEENKGLRDENVTIKRRSLEQVDAIQKLTQEKTKIEKQLMQNEEYQDLMLSQMDRMRTPTDGSLGSPQSSPPPSDTDPRLNADIEKAVSVIKRQIKELTELKEVVFNQRKQIQSLVKGKKRGNKEVGERHKVPSENSVGVDLPSMVMQCEEDLRTMRPDSPNQTRLMTGGRAPRRSKEHSDTVPNPFDFCLTPSPGSAPATAPVTGQSAPSPHQHLLRRKTPARTAPDLVQSSSHARPPTGPLYAPAARAPGLRDSGRSQSAIIPGGDIFENTEDIYNESLPPGGAGSVGRSFTAPAGYRHSTGQMLFGNTPAPTVGTGEPRPTGQEWTEQAMRANNRPEPIGGCTAVENRHRPQAMASQPRPLNIDRNVDEDSRPTRPPNEQTNVNLFPGEGRGKNSHTADLRLPELLNNDPLVTTKRVSPQNLFTEDVTPGRSALERTDLAFSAPLSTCPVCSQEYPVTGIEQHVSECLPEEGAPGSGGDGGGGSPARTTSETERVCPMCSETFDNVVPQSDFEAHVNRHFGDDVLNNFEVISQQQ